MWRQMFLYKKGTSEWVHVITPKKQCHYTKEAKWNPLKSEHPHHTWIPATSMILVLDSEKVVFNVQFQNQHLSA